MASKTKIIRAQAGFQEQFVRTNVDFCVGGGVLNCGKAQPLDSDIFTPMGIIKMGDLHIGDTICDSYGNPQMVLNIYEKGLLDSYKINFDDGTNTRCCDEHLWTVFDISKHEYTTLTLRDIIDNGGDKYRFPLCNPIQFTHQDLPIDPYLLGVILGDGHIFKEKGMSLYVTTDEEIMQRAFYRNPFTYSKHIPKDRAINFTITDKDIRNKIVNLGLTGTLSHTKFIPKDYLYSSIEQRTELLRGLFDTDGYNDKKSNRVEYTTTSEQLCKDVCFLVRSLGGKASVGSKIGHYRDENGEKVICKKAYRIQCRFKDVNHFITLPRKKVERGNTKDIYKTIESIESIGKEEMRCILVSNPNHLYLTDDFIVTHNTFSAVLAMAEPAQDPKFRALFLRNNLGDLKAGGGILDTFREVYGNDIEITTSGDPKVKFKSGAEIDVTHVNDQTREVLDRRFKGRQYDVIYFDEGTGFTWECFTTIISRNRGISHWTGHMLMTTNPEREHWLRVFLDWYIGIDGFIREDRAGVVRYFYILGNTVKDVVWGDTKEEVYERCKVDINRKIHKVFGKDTPIGDKYKNMIKSFTFYLGKMSENKASMGNNENYIGTVAMAGGVEAQKKLEGNWNVSEKDNENVTIRLEDANRCFIQDPRKNGDKWVTCDLADTGTDNFLALAWDGFHVTDMLILKHSTPRQNADALLRFAREHDVVDRHIIYDAVRGTYINDYIHDAVQFVSYRAPMGLYGRLYMKLKDECYARLVEAIKKGNISFEEKISHTVYEHQLNKESILVQTEFIEECSVVRFTDAQNGKRRLLTKKEMNKELGKGRSMDLLDPCAMRMLPVLQYPYGDELTKSEYKESSDDEYDDLNSTEVDLYDETIWY